MIVPQAIGWFWSLFWPGVRNERVKIWCLYIKCLSGLQGSCVVFWPFPLSCSFSSSFVLLCFVWRQRPLTLAPRDPWLPLFSQTIFTVFVRPLCSLTSARCGYETASACWQTLRACDRFSPEVKSSRGSSAGGLLSKWATKWISMTKYRVTMSIIIYLDIISWTIASEVVEIYVNSPLFYFSFLR